MYYQKMKQIILTLVLACMTNLKIMVGIISTPERNFLQTFNWKQMDLILKSCLWFKKNYRCIRLKDNVLSFDFDKIVGQNEWKTIDSFIRGKFHPIFSSFVNLTNKGFKCDLCNATFCDIKSVTSHCTYHQYEKENSLDFISQFARLQSKSDETSKAVFEHVLCLVMSSKKCNNDFHTKSQSKTRQTQICQECFSEKIKTFVRLNYENDITRPFKCHFCEKQFMHYITYYRHIQSVHINKKIHKCPKCYKIFTRKEHISRHILKVHDPNKKRY